MIDEYFIATIKVEHIELSTTLTDMSIGGGMQQCTGPFIELE